MILRNNSSKKLAKPSSEDISSSLNQKINMIAILKSEVEALKPSHEKCDQKKEELMRLIDKYESLSQSMVFF